MQVFEGLFWPKVMFFLRFGYFALLFLLIFFAFPPNAKKKRLTSLWAADFVHRTSSFVHHLYLFRRTYQTSWFNHPFLHSSNRCCQVILDSWTLLQLFPSSAYTSCTQSRASSRLRSKLYASAYIFPLNGKYICVNCSCVIFFVLLPSTKPLYM